MDNFKNKIAKPLVKLVVSAILIWWLIEKINWAEAWLYAQKISIGQIILYVGVLLLGMAISAFKWTILARPKNFHLSATKAFKLYLIGTFINNFMPSFVGGDTYRAYQLGKDAKKYSAAAASVVMDRMTGLLGAMILSLFFGLLNWRTVIQHQVLLVILFAVLAAVLALILLNMISHLAVWKKFSRFVPQKVLEVLKDFADYRKSPALAKALFLAIIFSFVGLAMVNYVLFWAMGIHIGMLNYLTVIFLISIVSSVPVSINNIGIKEWAYVTFFGFFGVNAAAVVAVSLISRILQMLVSFVALPMYLREKKS